MNLQEIAKARSSNTSIFHTQQNWNAPNTQGTGNTEHIQMMQMVNLDEMLR